MVTGSNGVKTKISLFSIDGRKYEKRSRGEKLHPHYILATVKNPVSVLIWSMHLIRWNWSFSHLR